MVGCVLREDHLLPPPHPPNVQGPQGPGMKPAAVSNALGSLEGESVPGSPGSQPSPQSQSPEHSLELPEWGCHLIKVLRVAGQQDVCPQLKEIVLQAKPRTARGSIRMGMPGLCHSSLESSGWWWWPGPSDNGCFCFGRPWQMW